MGHEHLVATTYLGSKYYQLPWLLKLLPLTHAYTEAFGGSAIVLVNRPPVPVETYNDLNQDVVNFFRVLRDTADEFVRLLALTPHSRAEYDLAGEHTPCSEIEQARRFFIRCNQSMYGTGAQRKNSGWKKATNQSRVGMSEVTNRYLKVVEGLPQVVARFQRVQIECIDFRELLVDHDMRGSLIYCDPPYDEEKRSGQNDYKHDFGMQDFYDLRDLAAKSKAKVAISGYDTSFMREVFADFKVFQGPVTRNRIGHECLWTNYDPYVPEGKLFH